LKSNPLLQKGIIHFVGIGGIGISALAQWYLTNGYKISGSDAASSEHINKLKKLGMKISIGHKAQNIPKNADFIIYSVAVKKDNCELIWANKCKIPGKSYAQALGDLTRRYKKTLAVSGAHGKSTTTGLLSLVLIKAKFDPTVIIGTKLKEFKNTNFKKGDSDYFLIEADEYNSSFLHYSPFAAIITNIDREHLDYYKNLNNIKNAFLKFISSIKIGGILVANKDNQNLYSLNSKIKKIVKKRKLKIIWYSLSNKNLRKKLGKILKIPGNHNISNAMAVYHLAKNLGISEKMIFSALRAYNGSWRRMEYRGYLNLKPKTQNLKPIVYDDYAHHPTEIKATLSAFRQRYPKSKIICVFQPHQEKRLKALFKEFTESFSDADNLILLDAYKVAGRESPTFGKYNSENLAKAVQKTKNSPAVLYLKNSKNLKKTIQNIILKPKTQNLKPIVIMMGAGDIYTLTNSLLK